MVIRRYNNNSIQHNSKHQTHSKQNNKNNTFRSTFWQKTKHRTFKHSHKANQTRKLLKQPVLSPAAIWDMEQDSEPELNIQYREEAQKESRPAFNIISESDDSENAPLLSPTRTPGTVIQSKLEITFEDKTSTLIYGRKQVARKTIARKALEPSGTLKPQ